MSPAAELETLASLLDAEAGALVLAAAELMRGRPAAWLALGWAVRREVLEGLRDGGLCELAAAIEESTAMAKKVAQGC